MRNRVQIIEYCRDANFKLNYNETASCKTGLYFKWFRVGQSRDAKILKQGAKYCMEYFNGHRWRLITGLIPIKKNLFYGDIDGETAAIWVNSNGDNIKIVVFKGHFVKYRSYRAKKVINFIKGLQKIRG